MRSMNLFKWGLSQIEQRGFKLYCVGEIFRSHEVVAHWYHLPIPDTDWLLKVEFYEFFNLFALTLGDYAVGGFYGHWVTTPEDLGYAISMALITADRLDFEADSFF